MTATSWPRRLGIVGGLGPHAHVEFERRLLKAAEPVRTEQDYPPWVLVSLPATPDRTRAIVDGGTSPVPHLRESLGLLAERADFAVIACITAHAFLDEVRPGSPLPILDLVEATLGEVVARRGEAAHVGVLATTGTLRSGLFAATAARLAPELRVTSLLELPEGGRRQEEWVMRAIYGRARDGGLKAGATVDPETGTPLADLLRRAAGRLAEAGADVVLTACTEIGMALGSGPAAGTELLDPLDVGARAALAVSRGERPLPGSPHDTGQAP